MGSTHFHGRKLKSLRKSLAVPHPIQKDRVSAYHVSQKLLCILKPLIKNHAHTLKTGGFGDPDTEMLCQVTLQPHWRGMGRQEEAGGRQVQQLKSDARKNSGCRRYRTSGIRRLPVKYQRPRCAKQIIKRLQAHAHMSLHILHSGTGHKQRESKAWERKGSEGEGVP